MSAELLDTAEFLLSRPGGPTPADTCRAISATYYALFHCLAKSCCDLFVGIDPTARPQRAWNHLYRSLNHSAIDKRCRKVGTMTSKGFDQKIIEFADFTRNMQWKREKCDYSFAVVPNIDEARNDIGFARKHLENFRTVGENHKRAFAVYLLVEKDRHEEKSISV